MAPPATGIRSFAECFLLDTRQHLALGKNVFTESRTLGKELHSVKTLLPSAKHSVKAALGKGPSAAVYN
jgi:hypothetical protein